MLTFVLFLKMCVSSTIIDGSGEFQGWLKVVPVVLLVMLIVMALRWVDRQSSAASMSFKAFLLLVFGFGALVAVGWVLHQFFQINC